MPIYRQGDVLLKSIAVVDSELAPDDGAVHEHGGIRLAEGESSGHSHVLYGARLCRYRSDTGRVVVVADSGADVRVVGGGSGGVDRHTPISLAPGRYEVRIQRSYDSSLAASRNVSD